MSHVVSRDAVARGFQQTWGQRILIVQGSATLAIHACGGMERVVSPLGRPRKAGAHFCCQATVHLRMLALHGSRVKRASLLMQS